MDAAGHDDGHDDDHIDVEMAEVADGWEDDARLVRSTSVASVASVASGVSALSGVSGVSASTARVEGVSDRDHRFKTLYDAVAGRVRVHEARAPKWGGAVARHLDTELAPEDALYRSSNAPDRFEETDAYFAHEALPAHALPASDLVKAVHHYASHLYESLALRERVAEAHAAWDAQAGARAAARRRRAIARDVARRAQVAQKRRRGRPRKNEQVRPPPLPDDDDDDEADEAFDTAAIDAVARDFVFSRKRLLDERSMDETALLAFGILLEEAARHALGDNGDLAFTEEAEEEEEDDDNDDDDNDKSASETPAKTRSRVKSEATVNSSDDD